MHTGLHLPFRRLASPVPCSLSVAAERSAECSAATVRVRRVQDFFRVSTYSSHRLVGRFRISTGSNLSNLLAATVLRLYLGRTTATGYMSRSWAGQRKKIGSRRAAAGASPRALPRAPMPLIAAARPARATHGSTAPRPPGPCGHMHLDPTATTCRLACSPVLLTPAFTSVEVLLSFCSSSIAVHSS